MDSEELRAAPRRAEAPTEDALAMVDAASQDDRHTMMNLRAGIGHVGAGRRELEARRSAGRIVTVTV